MRINRSYTYDWPVVIRQPVRYPGLVTWARDPRIPDLVNAVEAAEMLGISRQAVLKRANRGQLPGALVGKTVWVFRRVVIEKARDEPDD